MRKTRVFSTVTGFKHQLKRMPVLQQQGKNVRLEGFWFHS